MNRFDRIAETGFISIIIFSMIMAQTSCYYSRSKPGWEYMPDMVHSVAYETYAANPFFPDSMNAIQPVPNTIPRGVYMPFHYSLALTGYDSAGTYLHFPPGVGPQDLPEAKRLFEIYCAVCHGKGGKGDGSIVNNPNIKNPYPPPPSYFSETLVNLPEGKMYHSVHYGKNLMGPYSKLLNHDEVWKVIYYVKSLQQHYKDSIAALPPSATITAAAPASADTTGK